MFTSFPGSPLAPRCVEIMGDLTAESRRLAAFCDVPALTRLVPGADLLPFPALLRLTSHGSFVPSPKSGTAVNAPPFIADSCATNPGTRYRVACQTLFGGVSPVTHDVTKSCTRN